MVKAVKRKKKVDTPRRRLYKLHTWVGFHLALVMSIVLFTGTVATVSHEIDWLFQADMRVSVSHDEILPWDILEENLRAHAPTDNLLSINVLPGEYFAYRARMSTAFDETYFLHINQWTGEITGTTQWLTVQRFFRDLHRQLFMPVTYGLPLVTSLAFILLISLYTGLKTTRRWKQAATRIRFNKNARVATGDFHRAAGIWSIWFFIVVTLTSLWYLIEYGTRYTDDRFDPPRASLSTERVAQFNDVIKDGSADQYLAAAKTVFPDARPVFMGFPQRANNPVVVHMKSPYSLVRSRANAVYLDPESSEVLSYNRSKDLSWPVYLNQIADPLHFGYFAGLTTKVIWFIFGLLMTALSITGVWLTWKRLKSKRFSKHQLATLPILILMIYCGYFWFERSVRPTLPPYMKNFQIISTEDMQHQLSLELDAKRQLTGAFIINSSSIQGRPYIDSVEVSLPNIIHQQTIEIKRSNRSVHSRGQFPVDALLQSNHLFVQVNLMSGKQLQLNWDLNVFAPTKAQIDL